MASLDLEGSATSPGQEVGEVKEDREGKGSAHVESAGNVEATGCLPARSGTWGVGMHASEQLREAQLLSPNDLLPSVSDLLSHLKSLGLSHLVRSIQERVLAAVPAALIRPRFRPLKWKLGRVIGKGAFGECRMAMCEDTGALFAVKTVPLGGPTASVAASVRSVQRELEVLRGVSHPHVVDMFAVSCAASTSPPAALCNNGVGEVAAGEAHAGPAPGGARQERHAGNVGGNAGGVGLVLNIAMEYMEGGSLAKLIEDFGPLPEGVVASYARQIVLGLEYLHALGVVHADIKPANCLLDKSGMLKLSDFGCAQRLVRHSAMSKEADGQGASRKSGGLGLQVVSSRAELDELNDEAVSDGGAAVLGTLVCHEAGLGDGSTSKLPLMPEGTPNYMPSEVIRYRE